MLIFLYIIYMDIFLNKKLISEAPPIAPELVPYVKVIEDKLSMLKKLSTLDPGNGWNLVDTKKGLTVHTSEREV